MHQMIDAFCSPARGLLGKGDQGGGEDALGQDKVEEGEKPTETCNTVGKRKGGKIWEG